MKNVLVLGCGNIGALYDIDNNKIQTHCKALSKCRNVKVSVFDTNLKIALKVSKIYDYEYIESFENIVFSKFQTVVICTPTNTHFDLLRLLINEKVPLIICEKPISKSIHELRLLEDLYKNKTSKIIVNYFRRFHPSFLKLKTKIENNPEKPTSVVIKYQRGVFNNFSHAFDLINFLFNVSSLENINILKKEIDEFEDDPTTSFTASFGNTLLFAVGLIYAKYSYFEIEIFYRTEKISILNSGNTIKYFDSVKSENFYLPLTENQELTECDLLVNHMSNVYDFANRVYFNEQNDNFIVSNLLNKQLLNIING